jgi:ribosomal protein L37AE/L43A
MHRTKIHKAISKDLKPPFLVLCNHVSFLDFKVLTVALFPHRANYIVAIDGFIGPGREWLLRNAGGVMKRKFTNDIVLVRQLIRIIKNGDIAVIYPEARYSLCGTNTILPESLGKIVKLLKVPLVSLITHGHHIDAPVWNLRKRKVRTEADMTTLATTEEISELSVEEINKRIQNAFVYDDFAWQKKNKIAVTQNWRAEGLHKILYQCPNCKTEYKMSTAGIEIHCNHCDKTWSMSEYGELTATSGVTEFSHIPDWYEWERAQVAEEVANGTYGYNLNAAVDSLPNARGFISVGEAVLKHNMDGFILDGQHDTQPYHIEISARSIYSLHIEFDYLGKGKDCIDLNTHDDTFYIYPYGKEFSVTKMALATEELYKKYHE